MKRIAAAVFALITIGIVAGFLVPHAPPPALPAASFSASDAALEVSEAGHILVGEGLAEASDASSEAIAASSGADANSTSVPLSDLLGVAGLLGAAGVTIALCLRKRPERPSPEAWDTPQPRA